MNKIDKKVFSLFQNVNTISSISEKKKIRATLNDFINCICELYNINKYISTTPKKSVLR